MHSPPFEECMTYCSSCPSYKIEKGRWTNEHDLLERTTIDTQYNACSTNFSHMDVPDFNRTPSSTDLSGHQRSTCHHWSRIPFYHSTQELHPWGCLVHGFAGKRSKFLNRLTKSRTGTFENFNLVALHQAVFLRRLNDFDKVPEPLYSMISKSDTMSQYDTLFTHKCQHQETDATSVNSGFPPLTPPVKPPRSPDRKDPLQECLSKDVSLHESNLSRERKFAFESFRSLVSGPSAEGKSSTLLAYVYNKLVECQKVKSVVQQPTTASSANVTSAKTQTPISATSCSALRQPEAHHRQSSLKEPISLDKLTSSMSWQPDNFTFVPVSSWTTFSSTSTSASQRSLRSRTPLRTSLHGPRSHSTRLRAVCSSETSTNDKRARFRSPQPSDRGHSSQRHHSARHSAFNQSDDHLSTHHESSSERSFLIKNNRIRDYLLAPSVLPCGFQASASSHDFKQESLSPPRSRLATQVADLSRQSMSGIEAQASPGLH